jgi:hypothetical protein
MTLDFLTKYQKLYNLIFRPQTISCLKKRWKLIHVPDLETGFDCRFFFPFTRLDIDLDCGSVYAHFLICISYKTYESDYWSLFLSFHCSVYCKPTFILERENFTRFARTSPSRIFLVANQLFYAVLYEGRRLDRENWSPLTSLSLPNREIK